MSTIGEWFAKAYSELAGAPGFDDDTRLTLKFLIEARFNFSQPFHDDILLSPAEHQQLDNDLKALGAGIPLPYILGEWSFYGLDLFVSPAVLIPRPETELLVDEALQWLHSLHEQYPPVIYDIGTGSGAIAIAIAKYFSPCTIIATDISVRALDVCNANILRHHLSSTVSPLCVDGIPKEASGIDLLCANLPYIPSKTVDEIKVTRYEPRLALDGGPNGLEIIDAVMRKSVSVMNQHSLLLFEIEERQKDQAATLAQKYFPHSTINVLKDLGNKDRLLRIENV